MKPNHLLIALGIVFVIFLEIWEPDASKALVRTAGRIFALLVSCAFLYQAYQAGISALKGINTEASAPVPDPGSASNRFAALSWCLIASALAVLGISYALDLDILDPVFRALAGSSN
ncbi:hypothetical protein NB311A_07348 [Nitrobacter sp. Nb-311A]|uniref:hypothetical protein n=1 Tax=Nitrobacter sp. Nb-311A TaxID=314253 RepID=UPI0000684BDF|nr:hypothetical protein [Nitrobacter sp. Nb-311A]EAQ36946.1 hypothetical protein NB311A_07348 [Nitrobacter sp. Nb-311A]